MSLYSPPIIPEDCGFDGTGVYLLGLSRRPAKKMKCEYKDCKRKAEATLKIGGARWAMCLKHAEKAKADLLKPDPNRQFGLFDPEES